MNKKTLKLLKKITVLVAILILCSCSVANAFSFGGNNSNKTSMISSLINKLFNIEKYELKDLKIDLEKMKESGNIDMNKISELIAKLPNGEDKNILEYIKDIFSKITGNDSGNNLSSLLDTLMNAITSLLGGSGTNLPVEPTSINMYAKTAAEFAGKDYAVKLHANVYKHVDENGNEDSDKWALLIHPNDLDGKTIANKIGAFYYEKGYNIFAPDSRGFGDSEGEVALGLLESLDIYDWLNILNEKYNPEQVIIHGISLGGATTNFVSGIDQMMANGPTKISSMKSLRELKVIGLVEDCGYTDMTQFSSKSSLIGKKTGLTEDNFDYYSKATNSLKYCDLPMLIIHGSNDFIVKPENATTVINTVKGDTTFWSVDGGVHAFIIMGIKSDEYKEHVQEFIDKVDDNDNTATKPATPTEPDKENNEIETKPEEEKENFFDKLIKALKSLGDKK